MDQEGEQQEIPFYTACLINQIQGIDQQVQCKLCGKVTELQNNQFILQSDGNNNIGVNIPQHIQDPSIQQLANDQMVEVRGTFVTPHLELQELTILNDDFVASSFMSQSSNSITSQKKSNQNSQKLQSQETGFNYTEYAKQMRLSLSNKDIRKENGELNHIYFTVKKNQYFCPQKEKSLLRGLEIFGVGEWKDIKYFEFDQHNKTSEVELELRTCILLGVTNIKEYMGKRFTKQEIAEIKQQNIEIAKQKNKLFHGLYKND
ncbi:hypothetical protein PPERSA_11759 [Pseudocohnilembus persalinus]|uniref:Uncharacterized protein n=1 Tax=Pseudocohnilembus persalinus TaxID=266149 RepID=A0A0V0QGR8_PSEPJ|nr:hypothetical protein PPERSA_11759 [Pseudocohnilembus persalinus]|eukprot:KRX01312.1 hypothetical protein PPERSA_11759 [Pseudocohnilembus persalinus]